MRAGQNNVRTGEIHDEYMGYNKKLKGLAQKLRRDMTKQERKLWYDFLSGYGVKFRRQRVIDGYIAVFFFAEAKLVIELDGSQHYT